MRYVVIKETHNTVHELNIKEIGRGKKQGLSNARLVWVKTNLTKGNSRQPDSQHTQILAIKCR